MTFYRASATLSLLPLLLATGPCPYNKELTRPNRSDKFVFDHDTWKSYAIKYAEVFSSDDGDKPDRVKVYYDFNVNHHPDAWAIYVIADKKDGEYVVFPEAIVFALDVNKDGLTEYTYYVNDYGRFASRERILNRKIDEKGVVHCLF